MKKFLCGEWKFCSCNEHKWMKAIVPGCNFLDLMENGVIEDPFIGLNEEKAEWVGKTDWKYKRSFTVTDEELAYDEILLTCEMLDTLCDVYINGEKIASCNNCHIGYSFNIKDNLKAGENEILIEFMSCVNYVKKISSSRPVPPNSNGQNGIVFVRKPQCHFGWDWGPVLVPSGITRDIYLEFINTAKLENISLTQKHYDGKVDVSYKCEISEYTDEEYTCNVTLTHPDGKEQTLTGVEGTFTVENPELWWTYELSGKKEQPLYTVSATVEAKGKTVSEKAVKTGLRTLVLDRSKDKYGSNFRFILNGVPLFIKGGNFIPADSFVTRFTEEKMDYLLEAARFSNFNLIRIWGGGYYESDAFYSKCDSMGILLWQDFAFACQPYPFFEEDFLDNVKKEIEYNVKRLHNHPSLALWCGNNEIEAMSGGWMNMRKYIKWTEIFFHDILEKEIRKYDTSTSFIPGSPCGTAHNVGVNSDNVGDTHLWSVWHGLSSMKQYRSRMTRFCSEFGFESLPDIKSIRTFASEEDYSLSSKVFTAHQKCNSGNDKMFYYIRSRFNLPARFEDFVYLSQVTQAECMKDATEHWRRNKGRCNGAIYWQFNDCWPVCSWSSIDYYGNYKALQYIAKHFNAPLSVSIEDNEKNISIFVLNDLNAPQKVKLCYEVFDFEKGALEKHEKEFTVEKLENRKLYSIDIKKLTDTYNTKTTGIYASVYSDGKLISEKTLLLGQEKDLTLPKAELKLEKKIEKDSISVTVTADKFARMVNVSCDESMLPFSDNFFDLLPGMSKTVTIALDSSVEAEKQCDSISAISLTDIPTRDITLEERISQFAMMVSPMNIGNCIYHRGVPKDVEVE